MKSFALFFLASFLLSSSVAVAQEAKTAFQEVRYEKAADGLPCMQLAWEEGAENTSYYLVERSTDRKAFKTIALVFTAEDANFRKYTYRDKTFGAAGVPVVYYRLTMVSDKKELTYLPVQKVVIAAARTAGVIDPAGQNETVR